MSEDEDTKVMYRRFGAGKGLPLPEGLREVTIFNFTIVTILLCVLAIIISATFAVCFWILDKVL